MAPLPFAAARSPSRLAAAHPPSRLAVAAVALLAALFVAHLPLPAWPLRAVAASHGGVSTARTGSGGAADGSAASRTTRRREMLSAATSAQLTEMQGVLSALAGSPAFLLMASQSDLVTTLRNILEGNQQATILLPLPNAMDAAVGGAISSCNGYTAENTTLYQIIDGLKSNASLLADAGGTRYQTLLPGKYLVKNSASNATHVVLQSPSNERNATIVYPNLYKGKSFYVHGINNILVADKQ